MSTMNLSNKVAVLPLISVESGRSTKRQLIDVNSSGARGECVTQRVELTETVADKDEAEQVRRLQTRAQAAIDRLCVVPIKGLKVVDVSKQHEVSALVQTLSLEARNLTAGLKTCAIEIDCAYVPVELDASADTAQLIAKHVQSMLKEIFERVTKPDANKSRDLQYSDARNSLQRAKNLPTFCSGVNASAVVAGLQEAAENCKHLRAGTPAPSLPALENAIELFNPTTETLDLDSVQP